MLFRSGAAIEWLINKMRLISDVGELNFILNSTKDSGGVYCVPAFSGLGAPHWDMYARGMVIGLTRGTGKAHMVRAALESIAYQSTELVAAMAGDAKARPLELRVDGGASTNRFLMQFQADLLNVAVVRPAVTETTALGAALLAGLAVGVWPDVAALAQVWRADLRLQPGMGEVQRAHLLRDWSRAVQRASAWIEPS